MSVYFILEKQSLTVNMPSNLKFLLSFAKDDIFLYFENGIYHIWNIITNKLITEGQIENDLKYISIYNMKEIVYYSFSKQELKIYDIYNQAEKVFNTKVPTKQAIPENERNDNSIKTIYEEGSSLLTLPEIGFVILMERRNTFFNSNDNIITIFDEKSVPFFSQSVYPNQNQKQIYISTLNKNTLCVWGTSYIDLQIEFFIWEAEKKEIGIKILKLPNLVKNFQIIQVTGWKENQLIIIGNTADSPMIKLINYKEEKEIKDFSISNPEGFMINRFLLADSNNDRIVFISCCLKGIYINSYNIITEKINAEKAMDNENAILEYNISYNNNFIIEYETYFDGVTKYVLLNKFLIISKKNYILYLMKKMKITEKYGKFILQEILEAI